MRPPAPAFAAAFLLCVFALPVQAGIFHFSTGDPDGKMGMLSRPGAPGVLETEAADDFIASSPVQLNTASFTGILTGGATALDVTQVVVEIYRIFPLDSTNPPSGHVPTRNNSPSDVEFVGRDSALGQLTFTTSTLATSATVANSVVNGIHPIPSQTTGGDGSMTGAEVQFNLTFTSPLVLPGDHYFFVPQVQVTGGNFLWMSAPKPIASPGTPFLPDLQTWIRNADLDPDWLRVGTDIVGGTQAPTFNGVFVLDGNTLPEPAAGVLLAVGVALGLAFRRRLGKSVV